MAEVTRHQLAQILLGIARAQNAIVDASENAKAGFKATHLRPALETAARIKTNRPEALTEYPSRLLLQMIGRGSPDLDTVARDLERLLSAESVPPGATPTPAALGPASGDDENSLDMTR
jgi:hypothetical protein